MRLRETWVVVHDAWPEPVEFVHDDEAEARADYERSKFYDPSTGWGVRLVRRVYGSEVLMSTKPKKGEK